MKPPVLVMHAPGTNRDREVLRAFELAGGAPRIVTMHALTSDPTPLADARIVVLPGGFSYGDDLGAGKVWALQLGPQTALGQALRAHIAAGRLVLGICNGFQALVKAGLLPGPDSPATLTRNAHGRFECRWVTLLPNPRSPAPFVRALTEPITCPIAHGEGRVVFADTVARAAARAAGLGAFTYEGGSPNGSDDDLAGLTNAAGTVLGMMPHPEDHVLDHHHDPRQTRAQPGFRGLGGGASRAFASLGGGSGLTLFRALVQHATDT